MHLLLVTASVVPSSPIVVTLIKEALSSRETSVLTRTTRRNVSVRFVFTNHYLVTGFKMTAASVFTFLP
jgi:hypothetical protein